MVTSMLHARNEGESAEIARVVKSNITFDSTLPVPGLNFSGVVALKV